MGECNYEIPGLPYPAFRMWNAEAGMVATVSEFLTVGSSHTCIPNSMRLLLAAGSRFGREEPAVRKALTAATSYPAFRKMNAEAAGRRAVPLHLAQLDHDVGAGLVPALRKQVERRPPPLRSAVLPEPSAPPTGKQPPVFELYVIAREEPRTPKTGVRAT